MLLENGNTKFTLLSREGNVYREKPIAPKRDWLMYDGSHTGNRYSTLDQINASNVQRLAPVWTLPMPESRPQLTPVVVDGIMYVTGWNEMQALDATTGRTLWSYKEPRHAGIVSEAGIGVNRGATIVGDRVFMITDHAHVLGFNRFTGQRLWAAEMGSYLDSYSATSPPLPVGDLLVVGVAGGEEGARGFLDAYRASTGERVWRFYTIPKRGEPGSETWIGQALEHGCGATWMPGSYDPELDVIYWAIGNPCPDFAGEERIGDNLYTSSVVALEAKTGRHEVVLPVHAARHARLGRRAADGARRRDVGRQAAQAAVSRRSQRNLLRARSHERTSAEDGEPVDESDLGKGIRRRRQADRRSRLGRDEGRHRRVPGRRRRRQFPLRLVQPRHEAVLCARQRQLPGLHVT